MRLLPNGDGTKSSAFFEARVRNFGTVKLGLACEYSLFASTFVGNDGRLCR